MLHVKLREHSLLPESDASLRHDSVEVQTGPLRDKRKLRRGDCDVNSITAQITVEDCLGAGLAHTSYHLARA